ncbi:MAG: IS630 family transposase [Bacteroidetes bacterium]|nr:IS630 family transposase [Bacteroidota bacterium]MDE2671388.1 IS630 family transposase [Bacteroidota bacterium]
MKRYIVELESGERGELEAITRKGSHRSQKVINALVLLNCDRSKYNERCTTGAEIAGVLRISMRRVDRVKKRFVEDGLEAALGGRQGRRARYLRKADGEFEARLIALSCSDPPDGHAQWSLRLLAEHAVELGYIDSVSHETVRRVPKKNDLKPLRRVGWVIPPQRNADFAAGMERVLDLYRRPYDAYFPLVCMDETPRQLIGETRRPVPPAPGRPAREDYEYRRLGTCNVFMATEPLTGWRLTKADWAHFLRDIAAQFSGATRITLVMDNLNTHRPGALYDTFEPAEAKVLWDRFEFVYTPKHGSWLNVAEVEINVMIRQCLNRRIDSIDTLRNEVAAWQAARDQIRANVDWQFTTDDARVKLKCLYPTFDV